MPKPPAAPSIAMSTMPSPLAKPPKRSAEDGVDVAEDRGAVERLGLGVVDPADVVHGAILADRSGDGSAHGPASAAGRRRRRCRCPGSGGRWRSARRTRRARAKACIAGGDGLWPGYPAVSFSGMRFTWAPRRPGSPRSRASARGLGGVVVHARDARVLEGDPAAPGRAELRGGVEHLGERVPAVERDQLVAQRVVGRVQRDREGHRERLGREPADAGHDADGRDREVTRREPEVAVQALDRRPTPRRSSRAARPCP